MCKVPRNCTHGAGSVTARKYSTILRHIAPGHSTLWSSGAPSQAARDAAVLAVLAEFYQRRAKLLSRAVKHVVATFPQDLPVPLVQQVLPLVI